MVLPFCTLTSCSTSPWIADSFRVLKNFTYVDRCVVVSLCHFNLHFSGSKCFWTFSFVYWLFGYHFEILMQTKGCLEGNSTYKWKTSFTWFQGLTERLPPSFLGLLANTWPYCQAAAALSSFTWPHLACTLCLANLIALLCPACLISIPLKCPSSFRSQFPKPYSPCYI